MLSFLKKININEGSNIFFPHHNRLSCIYINRIYETKDDKSIIFLILILMLHCDVAFLYFLCTHLVFRIDPG